MANPVLLATHSKQELFDLLDHSEGEIVLDLSFGRDRDDIPFLRVVNGTPQIYFAKPLPELDEGEYSLESHDELSREKFNRIIDESEVLYLKPRPKTPFSSEVQRELQEKHG